MSNAKGDEVDDVVVVEIKFVSEQFSNPALTKSPPEKFQANSLCGHPTYNPIVAGTICERRLRISTS